jgi:hypothetical protein
MTALKLSELKGRNTLGGKTKILSYREVAYIFNSGEEFRTK